MPWEETSPVKELVRFIGEREAGVYRFGGTVRVHRLHANLGTSLTPASGARSGPPRRCRCPGGRQIR